MTVNILADTTHGAVATVLLDGTVLQTVDTSLAVSATQCAPISATASNLVDAVHNITVVQSTAGYVDMQSFVCVNKSFETSISPSILMNKLR